MEEPKVQVLASLMLIVQVLALRLQTLHTDYRLNDRSLALAARTRMVERTRMAERTMVALVALVAVVAAPVAAPVASDKQ